ncbi:mRNA N(6)-methyladenine demethylase [Sarracenia purpurea var. burkii]
MAKLENFESLSGLCNDVNGKRQSFPHSISEISLNGGLGGVSSLARNGLSEEQERIRFAQIGRKKDFSHIERIDGRATNVLQGLELHTQVFNAEEQKEIVDFVYSLQRMGQNGRLRARTYSEPKKWMRGKGRVTMQFGCCYNYAVDKNGNPPGIVRDEEVDPLPLLFKQMINRMRWRVFGPVSIPLPVGSVLILSGNGADIVKHCVPGVPAKRISITFRKMDDNKQPHTYSSDPDLMGIKPILRSPITKVSTHQKLPENNKITLCESIGVAVKVGNNSIFNEKDDFPPLANLSLANRPRRNRNGSMQ